MPTVRLVALLAYSVAVVALVIPDRDVFRLPVTESSLADPPLRLRLAAEVLRTAERLQAAQVGYAGMTPVEVLAWRVVLQSEQADSLFRDLLRSGTRPGQLYALAGLRFLVDIHRSDVGAYRSASQRLAQSRERVPTTIGCILSAAPLGSLVHEIDAGAWTDEFLAGRLLGKH